MLHVILPQAFKIVLPALGNEFIALIKDSSIALVISYQEITYWAKSVGYEYYNAFTPLVAAGCVYLIITIPLGKLVQYIEKKYSVASPRKEGAGWLGKRRKAGGGKPEGMG
jgi:polar amino acid transport system permease protein